ncbi:MAG: hypothetical protein J6I64_04000 [Lachnospiraceae bacterium]|nr:hypothetical protein [Lachnospiraceae bacterium]
MGQSDICLKRYLCNEERFADLINGIVGEGEQLISAEDLTDMDSQIGYSTVSSKQDQYTGQGKKKTSQGYRDLLKKAAFGVNFVVIGIEHQEHTNYLMPLRCMGYDVREYERQASVEKAKIRKWKKMRGSGASKNKLTQAEFLSEFQKESKLHPCVTIVLYFGEGWDAAATLHELLDFTSIPDKLRRYVNEYNMHLVDVRNLQDTERFRTDLKLVFDCIRFSKEKEKFYQYVIDNPAFSQLDEDTFDVIARYTNVLKREEVSMESKQKGGKINMCKAMEDLIADGRAEGRAEGRASSVVELLKELGGVSEELVQRIMGERDINVLRGWIKLAARAGSIQEFELEM